VEFGVVTPCTFVGGYRRFWRTCCLRLRRWIRPRRSRQHVSPKHPYPHKLHGVTIHNTTVLTTTALETSQLISINSDWLEVITTVTTACLKYHWRHVILWVGNLKEEKSCVFNDISVMAILVLITWNNMMTQTQRCFGHSVTCFVLHPSPPTF
jgi:hypothetical protein